LFIRWCVIISGYTPFDHKRNENILEELKVEAVDEKLRRYKSHWLRHVTRMNNIRVPKIMLNYRPNFEDDLEDLWRDY